MKKADNLMSLFGIVSAGRDVFTPAGPMRVRDKVDSIISQVYVWIARRYQLATMRFYPDTGTFIWEYVPNFAQACDALKLPESLIRIIQERFVRNVLGMRLQAGLIDEADYKQAVELVREQWQRDRIGEVQAGGERP